MPASDVTILVVDDDVFTAELTGLSLEAAGYGVLIAEGGLDALEKLAENPSIRLVVSDLNMPIMDGVELFGELRQRAFRQPFVLLSGQEVEPCPGMAARLVKDEHLQEALPRLVGELLGPRPDGATGMAPPQPADAADLSVPGLEVQVALNALNGNRSILHSLLDAFWEEYQGFAADGRSLCGRGDVQECLARLHTLKGSAGMLGATRLPAAIVALEAAPDALDPASRAWGEFEAALLELLQGIRASRPFEPRG